MKQCGKVLVAGSRLHPGFAVSLRCGKVRLARWDTRLVFKSPLPTTLGWRPFVPFSGGLSSMARILKGYDAHGSYSQSLDGGVRVLPAHPTERLRSRSGPLMQCTAYPINRLIDRLSLPAHAKIQKESLAPRGVLTFFPPPFECFLGKRAEVHLRVVFFLLVTQFFFAYFWTKHGKRYKKYNIFWKSFFEI